MTVPQAQDARRYVYVWGNNEKRAAMVGRVCRIIASGRMRSSLVEFENGQRELVDRWALRKVTA